VSHTIIIVQDGTGGGGSAIARVEYTPDHAVPPVLQIRKAEKAKRVLRRLNDYLYAGGAYPLPDEDGEDDA
jgi:hypothetical protein